MYVTVVVVIAANGPAVALVNACETTGVPYAGLQVFSSIFLRPKGANNGARFCHQGTNWCQEGAIAVQTQRATRKPSRCRNWFEAGGAASR